MKIRIPLRLLKIEGDGFHLGMSMKINGKAANAILDTGASKTVFDKTRIAHFLKKEELSDNERLSTGLGTNTMTSQAVEVKKLQFGKLTIEDYSAIVLDLNHVNETYHKLGLKKIDAVIGSDILERFMAVIDYGNRCLVMTFPPKGTKKTVRKKK